MRFNVAQLLKEPVGSTRSYNVEESFGPLEHITISHVRGSVRLTRTDKGVWASASLETDVQCSCGRCLKEFRQPLTLSFEEEYRPTVDVITGVHLTPADEDEEEAPTIDERHVLDLTEVARQYAITTVPMKPLCQSDCRGLCSMCGANLNKKACRCAESSTDQRLIELPVLLEQSPKET
ncbi:MAG: DUF177 domain-containing protein [Chloroflexi bacterium]|nr:DUF177 domain-containing protein [Chloroflexota bacterium]